MSHTQKKLIYIALVMLVASFAKAGTTYNCDGKDFGSKKGKVLMYLVGNKNAKCTKTDNVRLNEDKGTVVVDRD